MVPITIPRKVLLFAAVLAAMVFVRSETVLAQTTCPNLNMVWHDPQTGEVLRSDPYVCGSDLCAGYRCKVGSEISPACYNETECPAACAGECVNIQTAQLDCQTMCASASCGLVMTWYQHHKLLRSDPYDCTTDACGGFRCLDGNEISPACYTAAQCAKSCKTGTCIDIPTIQAGECNADLCSLN